jgi:hypothetical protein
MLDQPEVGEVLIHESPIMKFVAMLAGAVALLVAGAVSGGSKSPGIWRVTAADIGGGQVLVRWDESEGPVEFLVERAPAWSGAAPVFNDRTFLIDTPSSDEVSYRVRCVRTGRVSLWVRVMVVSVRAPPEDENSEGILRGVRIGTNGWAELSPLLESRVIYVSSSRGSDSNDGLSPERPKRTIAAGYRLLRDREPDWLLLRSGDTWEEGQLWWTKSGRSPSERMVMGSYGEGPRPLWKTGTQSGIAGDPKGRGLAHANLVFRDLRLVQHRNEGTSGGSGFQLLNGWRDVLIENCLVERYRVNLCFQAYTEGVRQSRIAVRRSVIVDALATNEAHAQGIFAEGVDGLLLEENVLDRNGWGPGAMTANIFRHNVYVQTKVGGDSGCTNVVTRGNISARAAATGLMQRPGGVVEGNLFLQNPIAVQFGYSGGPPVGGVVRGNVVLDARDIRPGEPRAFGVWVTNVDGALIERNIVAHQETATYNAVGLNVDGRYAKVVVRDNIVYAWAEPSGGGAALTWHGSALSGMEIVGNQFQQVRGGGLVGHYAELSDGFSYRGNRYYGVRGGRDEFWTAVTYAQWLERTGERESSFALVQYADTERTIARYMEHLGLSGGLDEFLREAREQGRHRWRPEYAADAVNRWVAAGFVYAAHE